MKEARIHGTAEPKRDLKGLARNKLREHYIIKEKGRDFQQDRNYSKGG